ncbi:MAG: L-arabinonate dehydratase [Deltaproteobacteria bacterium]|nr:L-arabinonate dehydratase [Deltaproteobacteria bacterium]
MSDNKKALRSARWFADPGMRGFAHRQRLQQVGFRREEFMGKPVVAIVNTWSEISPCHFHLRERAEAVKRAVWAAGGFPLELPALSLGEVMVKPTTMMYRNLLALEAEELLRSHPVDGAVLLGGCDKTGPGLVMGALSMNLPAVFCPAGFMASGQHKGERVGAGTHTQKFWGEYRANKIDEAEMVHLETVMTRSIGTCNTMGTASTMTSLIDAMGLCLPAASSIPAIDGGHTRMASACGELIVSMIREDRTPRALVTRGSVNNAAVAYLALGGSTNAAIHLLAIAKRAGVDFTLADLDALARRVPVLANVFPAGQFLMEDFFFAGGLRALLSRVQDHLDLDARLVTGQTMREALEGARVLNDEVIRPVTRPVSSQPGLAVLRGNLAPEGCVIKPTAATPALMHHTGPALVFDSMAELVAGIDDPALDVTPQTVLVLRGAGPQGAPGMPEWGALPIPKKLLAQGVRDMVRLSDARMSGTHGGTCVLHISPESAVGGPLALVRTGDMISLDVSERRLTLNVSDEELRQRKAAWVPPTAAYERGYGALFLQHVQQAHEGCDFDFLAKHAPNPEPEIY